MDTEKEATAKHYPPDEHGRFSGFYIIIFAVLMGLYFFQLWIHAIRTSPTFDEGVHLLNGYRNWQCGDFGNSFGHPPLLKLLAAAPLNFQPVVESDWSWDCGSRILSRGESFFFGAMFLAKNGVDRIIIPARLAAMVMSLLLATLMFFAAWEMFGRWAALSALAVFAFEPNLIAHGSLVTTDMAVSAGIFAAVFALYRYCKKPGMSRFLVVGAATGLTLASKTSGFLILPILFLLLLVDILIVRKRERGLFNKTLRYSAAFGGFVLIGWILLWACYGFRYYSLPGATQETLSIEDIFKSDARPEAAGSLSGRAVLTFSRFRLLPESYIYDVAYVLANIERPTTISLNIFDHDLQLGHWFYFPIAFLVKSSVTLLLLLPIGLFNPKLYRESRREIIFLLVPSLLYFSVAMTSGLNIGVRHILPVYPFFIVVAAAGGVRLCRKFRFSSYVLIALLFFHVFTAARTAPNYIAFANDFSGGTNNTYRFFRDSNVEWGQNIKLVNEYITRENIKNCWFASYGIGELARTLQSCRLMPGAGGWDTTEQPVDAVPPVVEGTILLSAMVLPPYGNEYLSLSWEEPVGQIGGSIFVYKGRFELPLVAALSHAARADQFTRLNRFEEAVAEGRKAVELASYDLRTHLSLGWALGHAGQKDEALRELETANQMLQAVPALWYTDLGIRVKEGLRHLLRE